MRPHEQDNVLTRCWTPERGRKRRAPLTSPHVLGAIVSKIVLGVIFFLVVTPIGVIRRWIGADALQLRTFKSGRSSVMTVRNHTYTAADLEHPY